MLLLGRSDEVAQVSKFHGRGSVALRLRCTHGHTGEKRSLVRPSYLRRDKRRLDFWGCEPEHAEVNSLTCP